MNTDPPIDSSPTHIHFHPHALCFVGRLGAVAEHVHAAPALLAALDAGQPLRVATGHGPAACNPLWWVPPGIRHRLDGGRGRVAVVYLEPGSRWAQAALGLGPAVVPLAPGTPWAELPQRADGPRPGEVLVDWLGHALGLPGPGTCDTRVHGALQGLRHIDDGTATSAARLAANAALSPSRMRHLFTPGTGTPLRRYRLWRRLITASRQSLQGARLAQAAASAGFADQAHFSRSFRTMFGVPPTAILGRAHLHWSESEL